MKKLWVLCLSIVFLLTLTACGQTAPAASQSALLFESGAPASTGSPAAPPVQTSALPATPANTPGPSYTIKTEQYEHQNSYQDFTASYPQLESGSSADLTRINQLIKDTALQDIQSYLTEDDDGSMTTVEMTGAVTYSDPGFISIKFEENYNNSMAAHPSSVFRTLNINLANGATVTGKDMIVKNDALYQAMLDAANDQLSDYLSSELTTDIIEEGLSYSDNIYFTPDRLGISFEVYHALGDHLEVTLPYAQAKPFMTNNALWQRFS